MPLCVDPSPGSIAPYEFTSAGIFLRGPFLLSGNLLLGETNKTLPFHGGNEPTTEVVVELVKVGGESDGAVVDADTLSKKQVPAVVPQNTAVEFASHEQVAVECDVFVDKLAVSEIHDSEAPVVVRTNTVARRGEAASLSPEGQPA